MHDPSTDSYVTAPSKINGQLLVSWRWSLGRWLAAWVWWCWRMLLRILVWALILAIVWVAYAYLPWDRLCSAVTTSFSTVFDVIWAVLGRFSSDERTVPSEPSVAEFVPLGKPRVGNG